MRFPKDVQIGKYYEVPHIFCEDFYGVTNVFIPINTPLHDDKEYINFSTRHYHVDWRFVSKRIHNIAAIDNSNPRFKSKAEQAFVVTKFEGDIVYKTVKCKRQFSNNEFHNEWPKLYNSWPVKLQAGYCGTELKMNKDGQYVCPHKGAIIDLKYVDEHGYAVCPAHLLRFDVTTLKAIEKIPNSTYLNYDTLIK